MGIERSHSSGDHSGSSAEPTTWAGDTWSRAHLACLATGTVLIAFFFGLRETATGIDIFFAPAPFTKLNAGQANFWLAQSLLLLPGGAFLGFGASPWLGARFAALWTALGATSGRDRALVPLAFAALYVALARLGRRLVLHDLAVTDEENTIRFGGQLLAGGKTAIPRELPYDVYPLKFLYERDGLISSFDFVGAQLAWAFGELTGLGPWVFAVISALPLVAVAGIVAREASWRWGLVAMLLLAGSPMFAFLSMTTHAHLVSRGFVALFYLCAHRGWSRGRLGWWIGAGLSGGIAFLGRPAESLMLLFPFGVAILVDALRRNRRSLVPIAGLAIGSAAPLAVFLLHNWAVTGQPLWQARLVGNEFQRRGGSISRPKLEAFRSLEVFTSRFGANVGYNAYRLIVWFAGLPTLLLAPFGARQRFTRLVLAGLLCHLFLLGMLHDNHGVHVVGPTHHGELAPGLAILVVLGLRAVVLRLRPVVSPRSLACTSASLFLVGLGLFSLWHGLALRESTAVRAKIHAFIDGADLPPGSILLLPDPVVFWDRFPGYQGSWVLGWDEFDPDADVLKLRYDPEALSEVAELYPERKFFLMVPIDEEPHLKIGHVPWETAADPDFRPWRKKEPRP